MIDFFSLTRTTGIILGTHREKGAVTFWSYALGFPFPSSSILCWKFCHVLHKILRDGHRNVRHRAPSSAFLLLAEVQDVGVRLKPNIQICDYFNLHEGSWVIQSSCSLHRFYKTAQDITVLLLILGRYGWVLACHYNLKNTSNFEGRTRFAFDFWFYSSIHSFSYLR